MAKELTQQLSLAEPFGPLATTLSLHDPSMDTVVFRVGGKAIVVLDHDGMTYKGERIEDAGAAHAAFMEVMGEMKKDA